MAKKPTIDDIARLASVSKTTISRVLNHKPDVDPATRERILKIIEEQGFVPSATASGLAAGRSRLIGMLIPTWAWPLIPELTRGIVEAIKQTQYDLVLYSINEEDIETDRSEVIDRVLATQLTAGLLAVFPERASRNLALLYKQGFPIVTIDDQEVPSTPWIVADNVAGAYSAVRHLLSLGHRRIAHIAGPRKYLVSQDRYAGYCKALLDSGITPDPALVLEGDFLPPSGRASAGTFFALPPEHRPTAIFAASDQMAYGVLAAAEEYGLSIPRDIALVGFDDDAPSAHTHPSLTTVRQPFYEMGQRGIELLLSMLDAARDRITPPTGDHKGPPTAPRVPARGTPTYRAPTERRPPSKEAGAAIRPGDTSSVHIQFPTSLVVRASCGADHQLAVSTSSSKADV